MSERTDVEVQSRHHIAEAQRLIEVAESCDWSPIPDSPQEAGLRFAQMAVAAAQAHATIALALRTSGGDPA